MSNELNEQPQEAPKHPYITQEFMFKHKEVIIPEVQELILSHWAGFNRPLVKNKILNYQYAIQQGQWNSDAGNPIKFDWNGRLIDGRNRMTAHYELGVPFITDIILGLDPKAILVQDIGKARSPYINPVLLAAEEKGNMPVKGDFSSKKLRQSIVRLMMANEAGKTWASPDSLQLEGKYETEREYVEIACQPPLTHWMKRPGPRAAIALYAKRDKAKAIQFRDQYLGDGAGFDSGSPVLLLRNRMTVASTGGDMTKDDLTFTIDAIHLFHEGKTAKRLHRRTEWEF